MKQESASDQPEVRVNRRHFLGSSAAVFTLASLPHTLTQTPEEIDTPEKIRPFQNEVGWAYTAVPGSSRESMVVDMSRMKELGASIVYIGHANPGEVKPQGSEPGLCPAVYFAMRDNSAQREGALSIYQAITNSLEASKTAGLKVVLPIGYQIQMGQDWNSKNPASLRLDSGGSRLNFWGSGDTASPYSPVYQRDIQEYYQWINNNFVTQYPHIVAINLGDEPMGSDFSPWAKEEFAKRYDGVNFDSAPQQLRGQFLSEVIADHAGIAANMWKAINPAVWTMMTFHVQRESPWLPNLEALFSKTPDNFVFSSDTHLHDNLPNLPLTDQDQIGLYGMVRTYSYLSKVYGKKMMLWSAANAWGLTEKGGIAEANRNFDIVHDIGRQLGGEMAMMMMWGWNIKGQGVYGYNGERMFHPDDMVIQMSRKMRAVKDDLSTKTNGQPQTVLYLPSGELYRRIGQDNVSHLAPEYVDLMQYDLRGGNIIYLNDGPALQQAQAYGANLIPVLYSNEGFFVN